MSRFEFDPQWVTEELYPSAELSDLVEDAGEAVLNEAVRIAGTISVTGEFERSIKGELVRSKNGAPFYRVWSDDPGALAIEFGTSKTNKLPHRVLGRAIGKWQDVNTHNGQLVKRKRRKAKIEKSIDQWVAGVLKRGR